MYSKEHLNIEPQSTSYVNEGSESSPSLGTLKKNPAEFYQSSHAQEAAGSDANTTVPEASHVSSGHDVPHGKITRLEDPEEISDHFPITNKPVEEAQGKLDAFIIYLANQLKQMPLKNAVSLQMQIHNLILEERLKFFEAERLA